MSEMWNSVAPAWEANAGFVDGHLEAATRALVRAAGVSAGAAVLEVAAGPGGAGLAAADIVGASGSVLLSDDAPEMVAAATRRAAGRPNVTTAVFDQTNIEAPDGSFDAVISRHGLMFADDTAATVREAVRVLRPGGGYAAMTWGPRAENPWLGLVLDAVGDQFGVPFPPPTIRGPFALEDARDLATALEDGGLTGVLVERVQTPMHAGSVEEWWDRVPKFAGPVAMALAAMEQEIRDAIAQRAMDSAAAAARHGSDGIVLDGAVLIASGRAPG
ncbi:class I SAM-dependent methyltransferase [Svornostia abyssi]|uniref:Class I SAM-dependent methyltransferase n=1 Tax=Svornostia abyssi TaxID=2898438 RepID=A0ABY5PL54_9ACTN|nr:class I SAM-dependent methyltransferase [Parviterribacteraceae bacterium J379]